MYMSVEIENRSTIGLGCTSLGRMLFLLGLSIFLGTAGSDKSKDGLLPSPIQHLPDDLRTTSIEFTDPSGQPGILCMPMLIQKL